MRTKTQTVSNDLGQLVEDARALITATADLAGEKVSDARKRLAAALERAKEITGRVSEKVIDCAKATDVAEHEHPYQALAIAFGLGAIAGYLVSRRRSDSSRSVHPVAKQNTKEKKATICCGLSR